MHRRLGTEGVTGATRPILLKNVIDLPSRSEMLSTQDSV
jgi:hypothetical protein